ncbi:MAG: hypothetical protein HY646_15940 [Acidobacteria bacterium]|nr:hypothetical protein [Acidobacteriota bacterium]
MDLPETVQQFITKYIHSVDQLEILLLLRNSPNREWTAAEVSRELFTQPDVAEMRLDELASNNLLIAKKTGDKSSYRYGAHGPLDHAVSELAQTYPKFRVSIINLIFSKPIDKIRTFADAFRLKKEEEED